MSRPSRPRTAPLVALAALLALGGSLLAACGGSSAAASKPPSYSAGSVVGTHLPAALMHLAFTDERGRTVHLSDYAGKTVVLQDVMTLCQELCPIDTATFVATAQRYDATASDPANTVFLSVTVDPQRDTPAQLAAYRRQYVGTTGALPNWHLLTARPADLDALWKQLGVFVKKVPQDAVVRNWRTGQRLTYDVQHSDEVFFLQGDVERYLLEGMPSLAGRPLPSRIRAFMSKDGVRNMAKNEGWTSQQGLGVLGWLTGSS